MTHGAGAHAGAPSHRPKAEPSVRMPDTVRLRLTGDRLPLRHRAPEVAERARRATLGRARQLYGANGIPAVLSGHDAGGPRLGHAHAFWLPEDADGDGRIDHHLTVHVPAMDGAALAALLAADVAVLGRHESWRAHWHWIGRSGDRDAPPGALLGPAAAWTSLTPYVGPWHEKPRFSQADMLRRECRERGLPPPLAIDDAGGDARERAVPRWRWRRSAPPGTGKGTRWRLVFGTPIPGPLALGYGCHFGLGLFGAERDNG